MKGSRKQESHQSKAPAIDNNKPRPDNKNNLDARENLEFTNAPTGHNKKATHKGDEAKNEHNDKRGSRPTK